MNSPEQDEKNAWRNAAAKEAQERRRNGSTDKPRSSWPDTLPEMISEGRRVIASMKANGYGDILWEKLLDRLDVSEPIYRIKKNWTEPVPHWLEQVAYTRSAVRHGPELAATLAGLAALEAKATPGPWEADGAVDQDGKVTRAIYHRPKRNHIVEVVESPDDPAGECIHNDGDHLFIVALRNAWPQIKAAFTPSAIRHTDHRSKWVMRNEDEEEWTTEDEYTEAEITGVQWQAKAVRRADSRVSSSTGDERS